VRTVAPASRARNHPAIYRAFVQPGKVALGDGVSHHQLPLPDGTIVVSVSNGTPRVVEFSVCVLPKRKRRGKP